MRQIILGFGRGDLILAALGMIWKPREVYSKHAATATEHQGRVTYPTTGIIRITYTDEQPGKNCFLDLFARGIKVVAVAAT